MPYKNTNQDRKIAVQFPILYNILGKSKSDIYSWEKIITDKNR